MSPQLKHIGYAVAARHRYTLRKQHNTRYADIKVCKASMIPITWGPPTLCILQIASVYNT